MAEALGMAPLRSTADRLSRTVKEVGGVLSGGESESDESVPPGE